MQIFHPRRHRAFVASDSAMTGEKTALQAELNFSVSSVNGGADDEQSIGRSKALVSWRVAATDCDGGRCFLYNLKVIHDLGALLISTCSKLLLSPELIRCVNTSVLVVQISSLNLKTCAQSETMISQLK